MDKKNLIIWVLDWIQVYWKEAEKLKNYIANNNVDENTLDIIIIAIKSAIKDTKNETAIDKLNKSLGVVESLKIKEAREREKEWKDLEDLEEMINNI